MDKGTKLMEKNETKICINCKYHHKVRYYYYSLKYYIAPYFDFFCDDYCYFKCHRKIEPIRGNIEYKGKKILCSKARKKASLCGKDGKWFVAYFESASPPSTE
jgi:hypothetical protein